MKTIAKQILFVIIAAVLILPSVISAKDEPKDKGNKPLTTPYKIVMFDDIDSYNPSVTTPNGTFNATYWLYGYYLKNSKDLGPYFLETAYSTFFTNHSITDFDIAIFPMGDNALTYSSGGYSVISTINTMLAANKRVILIGRRMLTNQYASGGSSDPTVDDFFSRQLGLQFLPRYNLLSGGTYKNFVVYAPQNTSAQGDTVSNGQVKYYNITITSKGQQFAPLRYNSDVEIFKLKNGSRSIPIDSWTRDGKIDNGLITDADLTYYYNKPVNDTLVGIRCYPPAGGKVVFWSVGSDNACDWWAVQYMQEAILYAAQWCSWEDGGIPWPQSYISFDQNGLDFGNVYIGNCDTLVIKVTNFGRTDMHISDIWIDGGPGSVFKLLPFSPPLPITLTANQSISFHIVFCPGKNTTYTDALDISTDATNAPTGGSIQLDLKGNGGIIPQGPVPEYNGGNGDTLFFGQVKPGYPQSKAITIKSIGTEQVFYQTNQMINNGNNTFSYEKSIDGQAPITIPPDSTYKINIRFNPITPGVVYTGFIRLDTKDVQGYHDLYFTGMGAYPSAQIFSRDTELNYGDVFKNNTVPKKITITNAGNKNLLIDSIYIVQDTIAQDSSNAYSLVNPPALPDSLTFNSGQQIVLTVQFAPMINELILGTVKVHSNDPVTPYLNISLTGNGIINGVNENTVSDASGLLSLKAIPNPFSQSTTIQYTLNGNVSRNIEIYAVDLLGNKVAELINTNHSPGEYRLNFDSGKLSSGTYFIIANSNDVMVRLPVAIVK